jgi:hypothetical protein
MLLMPRARVAARAGPGCACGSWGSPLCLAMPRDAALADGGILCFGARACRSLLAPSVAGLRSLRRRRPDRLTEGPDLGRRVASQTDASLAALLNRRPAMDRVLRLQRQQAASHHPRVRHDGSTYLPHRRRRCLGWGGVEALSGSLCTDPGGGMESHLCGKQALTRHAERRLLEHPPWRLLRSSPGAPS